MLTDLRACAVMALLVLATFGGFCPAANDRPITVEAARARAEACVSIAKATASLPCQTQECKFAEIQAGEMIVLAKLGRKSPAAKTLPIAPAPTPAKKTAPTNGCTLSADGRTLTCEDGKVLVLYTDGSFRPPSAAIPASSGSTISSSSAGCVTINGKTTCPLSR